MVDYLGGNTFPVSSFSGSSLQAVFLPSLPASTVLLITQEKLIIPAYQLSVASTQGTISLCQRILADFVFELGCSSWNCPVVAADPFVIVLIGNQLLTTAG